MRIALVSMPWALFNRPSIQLASLKAWLEREGIGVRAMHPYLTLAHALGPETYTAIARGNWAAESLYAAILHPERRGAIARVFHRALRRRGTGQDLPGFDTLAEQVEEHLDDWLDQVDWNSFDLVGFSVCFSQLNASLAALPRLKARHPGLRVVFGGSSCAGDLAEGLMRAWPEIDFVATGEGEQALLGLCRRLERGGEGRDEPLPGILERGRGGAAPDEVRRLDSLPLPDYSDYYADMPRQFVFSPILPVEFSRGCWWRRCAFCNLNLQWRCYRKKGWERMLAELGELSRRHACLDFTFTDNALPPAESARLLAALASQEEDFRFFAEIRAMDDPADHALLRAGGVRSVQVGIEALSDSLLARMDKGVTVMDNVAAMKFALEAGIRLDGNLILEFPGSTDAERDQTLAVLERILPLHPLRGATFFLGHGSPVAREPRRFGITALLEHPNERALHPRKRRAWPALFMAYRGDRQEQRRRWVPVRRALEQWQAFHRQRDDPSRPALEWREGGNFLLIRQERPGGQVLHHRLRGLSRRLYLACARPAAIKDLSARCNSVTTEQIENFFQELERKGLVFIHGDQVLALAVRGRGPGHVVNDTGSTT